MPSYSQEGAMGYWVFHSMYNIPVSPTPTYFMRAESRFSSGVIAETRIYFIDQTSAGSTVTGLNYKIGLKYWSPTGLQEVQITNPITDYAIGHSIVGFPPRDGYFGNWRWALLFKCSTFDGSTYANDGFVKLYLNDNLILSAINVNIPRQISASGVRHTFGIYSDADRVWGRTLAALPVTTSEGALTVPSDILFYEEFDSGSRPGWNPIDTTFSSVMPSNSFSDCGGDGGWGLSAWGAGPTVASAGLNLPYMAIQQDWNYPPLGTPPPVLTEVRVTQVAVEVLSFTNDNSGLYFPNPTPDDGGPGGGLDVPHDNYINRNVTPAGSIERKIPDPTIKTALIGE